MQLVYIMWLYMTFSLQQNAMLFLDWIYKNEAVRSVVVEQYDYMCHDKFSLENF